MSSSRPSMIRESWTVSSWTSNPAIFSTGNTCAPRRSKSESGEGKPYRCAPLIVANRSGQDCAATMRWRPGSMIMVLGRLLLSQLITANSNHASASGSTQTLSFFENGQCIGEFADEEESVAFVVPCIGIVGPELNGPIKADNGPTALFQSQ